jgi:hypothetical protein
LLTSETALSDELKKHLLDTPERRLAESKIRDAMTSSYNTIRLLLAEKGQQHEAFGGAMDRFMVPPEAAAALWHRQVFTAAAANILRRERAAIEAPGMMERTLRSRLGAVGGQPWSRLWAWLRRDPPRFPDLP